MAVVTAADHAVLAMATASVILAVTVDSIIVRGWLLLWWVGVGAYWIHAESKVSGCNTQSVASDTRGEGVDGTPPRHGGHDEHPEPDPHPHP